MKGISWYREVGHKFRWWEGCIRANFDAQANLCTYIGLNVIWFWVVEAWLWTAKGRRGVVLDVFLSAYQKGWDAGYEYGVADGESVSKVRFDTFMSELKRIKEMRKSVKEEPKQGMTDVQCKAGNGGGTSESR